MLDVTDHDEGEYACNVFTLIGTDVINIAKESIYVAINSYPSKPYPTCKSEPRYLSSITIKEYQTLTLTYASEKTNPIVRLGWTNSKSQHYLISRNVSDWSHSSN